MYTEENEKRGFPLKDFLLKLILVIIFVLLLIWLVPWPNNDSLKNQIFNANIREMKEAGILYFTKDRLPVNVGDRKTITLQEMLDLKLIVPFVDKDGKSCDVMNSYITLEKLDDEYLMKVYLKCSADEDYILVHIGCYAYCTTDVCEKKEDPTTSPTTKPTQGGNNGGGNSPKPTNSPTIKPTTDPTTSPTTSPTTGPTPTTSPTTPPDIAKEYEYKKHFATAYSNWTNWNAYAYNDSDRIQFGKTSTREIEDLGTRKVQTGTKSAVYEYYTTERVRPYTIGYVEYKVCAEWDYIISTTKTSGGSKVVKKVNGAWYETGQTGSGYNVPADTDNTKYEVIGIDRNYCGTNCTNRPYWKWKILKRSVTTIGDVSDSSTQNKITASCTRYETKKLDVQIQRTYVYSHKEKIADEEPIYGYVKFYRIRTRQITQLGYTNYLWSSYNDKTLLNQGYTLTGKSRTK